MPGQGLAVAAPAAGLGSWISQNYILAMGNHARIAVKTGLIISAGLLFLHCSDDPIGGHLLDQPFSKENYVFPGTVVDPAGSPVESVSVSMDYAYLYENQATPFALTKKTAQHATLDFLAFIEIYNLFEDPVKSLNLTYTAWDSSIFKRAPDWDHTDNNGDTVRPGLYFYNGICLAPNNFLQDSVTVLLDDQGGTKRYFKGWVVLTCSKSGYQPASDTVNVYEPLPLIVIR
jgi:hypothetical protein